MKNFIITIQTILIIVLAWMLFNKTGSQERKVSKDINQDLVATQDNLEDINPEIKLIQSEGDTWGYKILLNKSTLIIQPNIPGLPGNAGFSTQEQALKVADLVIKKLQQGKLPPSVSLEELQKLGIFDE